MLLELAELKRSITENRLTDAFALIEELDSMSRKSVIRTIRAYLIRLLVHLIKNQVEQKLTNSWAASIRDSVLEIQDLNLQDNKKSYYIKFEDWDDYFELAFEAALYEAAVEIFGGKFTAKEIAMQVDKVKIQEITFKLLQATYNLPTKMLSTQIEIYFSQLPGGEAWQ